jgi:nucleoside-diphosphate-sugar epimerase
MKTVVVTGASGFIGGALCARLESSGVRVMKPRRGEPLPRAADAVCVHLAANNEQAAVAERFEEVLKAELDLARRVLDAGYRRVVFASSAVVYGDGAQEPRREDSALAPASAYGRIKRDVEALFASGPHAVARISNVYGPGMSKANVFSRILEQLGEGESVRMRELRSVRDYVFVSDVAEALTALAAADASGVFNVSTGRGTAVGELVAMLARLRGKVGAAVTAENENPPASTLVLDPGRMAERLGWRAKMSLEDGLGTLIQ